MAKIAIVFASVKHQYSLRRARPENVAHFDKE
jgi:hypothetical protein